MKREGTHDENCNIVNGVITLDNFCSKMKTMFPIYKKLSGKMAMNGWPWYDNNNTIKQRWNNRTHKYSRHEVNPCTKVQDKKQSPVQILVATSSNPQYNDSRQEVAPVQAFKTRTNLLCKALSQEVVLICTKNHDMKQPQYKDSRLEVVLYANIVCFSRMENQNHE